MTYAQTADMSNQTHYQTRRYKQFGGKAVYRLLQRVTDGMMMSDLNL